MQLIIILVPILMALTLTSCAITQYTKIEIKHKYKESCDTDEHLKEEKDDLKNQKQQIINIIK